MSDSRYPVDFVSLGHRPNGNVSPMNGFQIQLREAGWTALTAGRVTTMQVNMGKRCNQACSHCHVDAGPNRTEQMTRETTQKVLGALQRTKIATLDITGGAPELNDHFRLLVSGARELGSNVIVRHNFTVQFTPGNEDLPEFFRDHRVQVVASLPCYTQETTDEQRGKGVFTQSIAAMKRLNEVGYALEGSGLTMNLVYNPAGASIPGSQTELEHEYRAELRARYGLVFNNLFVLANMPIARFRNYLQREGLLKQYEQELSAAFNPAAIDKLMCRTMVSVSWDGMLYDCDFNQMIGLPPVSGLPLTIDDLDERFLLGREIATGSHCFGCTAGSGSSCGGQLTNRGLN